MLYFFDSDTGPAPVLVSVFLFAFHPALHISPDLKIPLLPQEIVPPQEIAQGIPPAHPVREAFQHVPGVNPHQALDADDHPLAQPQLPVHWMRKV